MELPGQMLHAVRLGLNHPISGERLEFEAPPPPAFEKLLALLRRRAAQTLSRPQPAVAGTPPPASA
jgi:23S rRNA pseudouridine1911/1915/1917 synthase